VAHEGGLWTAAAAGAYLVVVIAGRWRYIARPGRANLLADVADIRAQLTACTDDSAAAARAALEGILAGLDATGGMLSGRRGILDWGGGVEVEASRRLTAAQTFVPQLHSDSEVRARLVVASGLLAAAVHDPAAAALRPPVAAALARPSATAADRALLGQALAVTYRATDYDDELVWHRKSMVVLVGGLALAAAVAIALPAWPIVLFGAVGGLLQRLWQLVYRRSATPRDPLFWSTLFLAPVAGALAAIGGLVLVSVLLQLSVLGTDLRAVGWDRTVAPRHSTPGLGAAFLLGFSARALGQLAQRAEQVLPQRHAT
jgi:hypothetical protein